ncbi:MAG: hypothetical protein ABIT76_08820 [Chthoniobacterales bacterium]
MQTPARTLTLSDKINALAPGGSVEISRLSPRRFCTAERSGDGRTVRFVRHIKNSATVFQQRGFFFVLVR